MPKMNPPRRRSLDDVAARELTPDERAAHAICVAIYSGHPCACEQRGKGSVCDTMARAALAALKILASSYGVKT
jgi:hypothetical protein